MLATIALKSSDKVLIIGPIYDKINDNQTVGNLIKNYEYTIFNGGLCHPDYELIENKNRITTLNSYSDKYRIFYILNKFDYLANRKYDNQISNLTKNYNNVAIIKYNSRNIVITGGGIPNNIKSIDMLSNNYECSFISKINEKPWHENYNGSLGYVVSNSPLTTEYPKFYSHSMQLGNTYKSNEYKVYAQEIDEIGLKKTISV